MSDQDLRSAAFPKLDGAQDGRAGAMPADGVPAVR